LPGEAEGGMFSWYERFISFFFYNFCYRRVAPLELGVLLDIPFYRHLALTGLGFMWTDCATDIRLLTEPF
jgi:hypothetical protein